MPRGQLPKKDAESGETWTGSCKRALSRPTPNGATRAEPILHQGGGAPAAECIGRTKPGGTRGTETSQYPEEEESTRDATQERSCAAPERPVVAASEPGYTLPKPCASLYGGVAGL